MFDGVKKVWTVLGTFGIVKPIGLLTLGALASGTGVGSAAAGFPAILITTFVVLIVLCAAGVVVLVRSLRRNPSAYFNPDWPPKPKPAPMPVVEPEPWTWTAEVVRPAPSAIDPPRVFIAGKVISSENVPYETTQSA